ncbi:MAG TPA: TIM barrel protein [Candidatus Dormibacteraeota bacterium]|jgi:inosose dehydratase|nr:TIM barrel protein [Candidatus Dormibacteraeota bacterium]
MEAVSVEPLLRPAIDRLAGAPISWGVCEVPGWGHRLSPARVLHELREVGLGATELGPPGFLPEDPGRLRSLLAGAGLRLVAGFVAPVLHRGDQGRAQIERAATTIAGGGGEVLVLAAGLPGHGYGRRPRLGRSGWRALVEGLAQAERIAAAHRLCLAVHPHLGTAVERPDEVERLLRDTDSGLCLDTGHLLVAGVDPLGLVARAGPRVVHVHLKDVDPTLAGRVRGGELAYEEAVRRGLFRPLGEGCLDLPGLMARLREVGYRGWYVLEQDAVLMDEPPPGSGPIEQVRRSLAAAIRSLRDEGG